MNKFDQYKLSLTEKQKKLVNDYLFKIKNFVEKHEIDGDLYNDIEEMVFEKLSLEKDITDLRVVKILQEVGEPEIIFSDFVETPVSDNSEPFYEKLQKTSWVRNNDGAIFLGISQTLSKKIGISVLAVRILLLVLIFPLGISIWFYVLAGILLPVVGVDYTGKSNIGYLKTQIILVVRNSVYNLSASFMKLIAFVGKFSFASLKEIFSFIVKNIFPVIRFVIFGCIGFFLSLGVLGLLTAGSAYFTHFSLENIDFVASLPNYFIYGIAAGAFALFVFAVASIVYGISKKVINGYLFLLGGISFLIAIFLGISTGFDLVQKYSQTQEYTQSTQIEVGNTGSYVLDIRKLSEMQDIDLEFFGINSIVLQHSTGSVLELKVKNTIRGNSDIYSKITQNLSPISFTKSDIRLELISKNNRIFAGKVPFTLITRDIEVHIPEGVKISVLNMDWYYFENAFVSNKYEKYSNFLRNDCRNAEIWYDAASKQFVCDVSEEELTGAKQEYLKQYLVEHFAEISPIQHKEQFKRNYYGDYGSVSDWNFPRIEFVGTGSEVNMQFGDRSLDIDATLLMEESQTGVIMKDFKINDVQVDIYQFDEKYYTSIDSIKDFLKEERD